MKAKLLTLFSCIAFAAPFTSQAILINGGFENGITPNDFPGWTAAGPVFSPPVYTRVTGFTGPSSFSLSPKEGSYFAQLDALAFLTPTTLSQVLDLNAGDVLSGWAAFVAVSGPMGPLDTYLARVSIKNNSSGVWTDVWSRSGTSDTVTWDDWDWTAASAGAYTLELRAQKNGAGTMSRGYAFFDANVLTAVPTATPDAGSTLLLLATAIMSIAAGRRILPRR